MKWRKRAGLVVTFLFTGMVVTAQVMQGDPRQLQLLGDHIFHLSEVMLHDATNPPAASRVYAYATLAAYEVSAMAKGRTPYVNARLTHPLNIQPVNVPRKADLSFCSNFAMLEVGRALMPSGALLEDKKKTLIEECKKNGKFTEREMTQQVRFALDVASQVIAYARTDGYNKLSTYQRYTPKKGEGFWYPTPPAYMGAVEPQWETVRPFFLDSASQYTPPPPAPFSKDSSSSFFRQMMEVYDVSRNLTREQIEIAKFWDCNPFAVSFSGHMAIGLKKISPGGHWMAITSIASKQAALPLDSAIFVHAVVAMTLHDAFISCWNEKYRSHRIRPETAINKYVDSEWRPLLQTPPFPEYTSGHSVASSSVSVVLTHLMGDNFKFIDTSEVYFGLPERSFNSFYEAAREAAVSRLYGGIHYRDACELGVEQGRKIGENVLNNLFAFQP